MEINIGRKVRLETKFLSVILEVTETVYKPLFFYLGRTGTSIVFVLGSRPSNCSITFIRDKGKMLATQTVRRIKNYVLKR